MATSKQIDWCRENVGRGTKWQVPNYPGMEEYLINEYGDLISFRKNEPHLMKKHLYDIGYHYYSIQINRKNKKIKVHRVVAKTFLDEKPGKDMVNHKDGDKTNNYYRNLEWCTNSENLIHAFRVLKVKHGGKEKKRVVCVETGEKFDSVSEAAIAKGTFRSAIKKVIDGRQKTAGGYKWQNA